MRNLKSGDLCIVMAHPAASIHFYGKIVTLVRVVNSNEVPECTSAHGTIWEIHNDELRKLCPNDRFLFCAEFILRKIDPDDDDSFQIDDATEPNKKISWNDCVWKPKEVAIA